MAANIIFSRRGIHLFPRGAKEYNALMVPSEDQNMVLRDMSPNTAEIAQRIRAEGRTPMWRERRGQIIVYGLLPPELKDIRQALRVWLAEDFAPLGVSAFFFVFENWVIHGVKEIDDERREFWRSTVLSYADNALIDSVTAAAADVLLRFPAKEICVAVDGSLDRHEEFKRALHTLDINCLPFAALRPAPKVTPLYKHLDFSVPMFASFAVLGLIFVALLVRLLVGYISSASLAGQIHELRLKIQHVQISKTLGYIHEPQPILDEMRQPFQQQPSAILDAAGRFAHALGELSTVEFNAKDIDEATGLMKVSIRYNKIYDKMLVNQETSTRQLLPQAPWIRSVESLPEGNSLRLLVQVVPPRGTTMASATTTFQTLLNPPDEAAAATPEQPSVTTMVPAPAGTLPQVAGSMPVPTADASSTATAPAAPPMAAPSSSMPGPSTPAMPVSGLTPPPQPMAPQMVSGTAMPPPTPGAPPQISAAPPAQLPVSMTMSQVSGSIPGPVIAPPPMAPAPVTNPGGKP